MEAQIMRERADGLFTVEVRGTFSWPEANVAACTAVAERLGLAERWSVRPDRAWMLVRNVRQAQHRTPADGYVDAWTVSVATREPDRLSIRVAGGAS